MDRIVSFDILYKELINISNSIRQYYDIDKIKPYSVSIWTKENEENENVFDIESSQIIFYNKKHIIIDEAKPIIRTIQNKLIEIELLNVN